MLGIWTQGYRRWVMAAVPLSVWPDWAVYWTLGNFLKPLAAITLSISPTLLGNFCKGVKIDHLSTEIILGNFYWHLAIFFLSHCPLLKVLRYWSRVTFLLNLPFLVNRLTNEDVPTLRCRVEFEARNFWKEFSTSGIINFFGISTSGSQFLSRAHSRKRFEMTFVTLR